MICHTTTTLVRAGLSWLLSQFSAVMKGHGVFVFVTKEEVTGGRPPPALGIHHTED